MYASHTANDFQDTQRSLQRDLDEIHKYGCEWAITFNTTKTKQQTFSNKKEYRLPTLKFGGDLIPVCNNHTHLGMTFSKDLHFHEHVNQICRKIHKTLSPLYPIAQYLPRTILDQIYKTYIRPHFDYCDTVYDGHITIQDATRLETLQNRAGRLVTGALFRTPTEKLLADLGWDKLTIRRRIHKLLLYRKLNNPNQQSPNYIQTIMPATRAVDTGRALRNALAHTLPQNRTTAFQKSFFITTGKQWNQLHDETRSLPFTSFKRDISGQLGVLSPPNFYTVGSKTGNILHTRLRTGMSHLNSHMFQIQKHNSAVCSCGHATENEKHFILSCPNYAQQRDELFRNIMQALHISLNDLQTSVKLQTLLSGYNLEDEDGRVVAHYFQKFIFDTQRFNNL